MGKSKGPEAWPVRGETYWCRYENLPVVGRECPGGERGVRLRLTDPGDARPAFEHDIDTLMRGFIREVGSSRGFSQFRGNSVILLNKVPFMDLMYEVVADGRVIGRLYWEPLEGSWRLRFSYPGLARIWTIEPLPIIRFNGSPRDLKRNFLHPNNSNLPNGSQVAFVNRDNEPLGIGYVRDDGERIKVHTVFWRRMEPYLSRRPSNWNDVVRANEYYLYYYPARSVKFIHVMSEKVRKPVIVSYSGGKDSLAALNLTLETGIEPYVLFNDTGIELPETRESVRRIVEEKGLKLLIADAGDSFWRAVEIVGPPGKDYRWCCKVTKLAPLSRLLLKEFPDGALNIVGQRAFESLDRARSPRVWRNRWLPHILNISPIQYWTQLLVWLYIWDRKLPYNPLYEKGFDRIGCFMCPAAFIAEYRHVEETHPKLWRKWEKILEKWASRIGLQGREAQAWIGKGVWRWLTPAVQKKRLAQRIGISLPDWKKIYKKWLKPNIREYNREGKKTAITFDSPFPLKSIEEQYTVLGAFKIQRVKNGLTLRGPSNITIKFDGKEIEVDGAGGVLGRELALDTAKLAFRWYGCAGCRMCETSCPTGAIKVVYEEGKYRPTVNDSRCIHCKLCLDNCPLADVVAEHIYSALALEEPTAWRRSGRRSKESVIQRYLKLKGYEIIQEGAAVMEEDVLIMPPRLIGEEE